MSHSTRRRHRIVDDPDLHDVLAALGHRSTERVSLCTKKEGSSFLCRVEPVRHLLAWTPPQDRNVYFGVNPVLPTVAFGRRGTENDVTRVYALFADLDVKDNGLHSLDECREVVDRLSRALTVNPIAVIESGHGLQPFYRIASPQSCSNVVGGNENRLDREGWRLLYDRWGGLVRDQVRSVRPGADIDNVYNLDRILRAPGSVNHKAEPKPVRTTLFPRSGALTWREILSVLNRDGTRPLTGAVRVRRPSVPTTMEAAIGWVNDQPGALCDEDELLAMHPARTMLALADRPGMVQAMVAGGSDDASAYSVMLRKVQQAVWSSTENKAGLGLALDVIRDAYLEVMELRRSGSAPGTARADADALDEFYRALRGAVGRAKARGNSPAPQRDSDGRIVLRFRSETAVNKS
ncbi:hypothetical protein [Rhodococcus sp. SORGH_AS_0301]|uniref:hypothetical protein n=1 Tax=Rhodococcus sp. SORGH_AS_0301 TaxID=3041780 RepID=UPI00278309CF|nr:hypothetical protein [Rhodococcus sp. SORGH_AS_0301]MDQ1182040.1 hypothetical protein [Rhodococcus sp. SORGH_AS_0301]